MSVHFSPLQLSMDFKTPPPIRPFFRRIFCRKIEKSQKVDIFNLSKLFGLLESESGPYLKKMEIILIFRFLGFWPFLTLLTLF